MKEAFEKRILTGKVSIALDSRTWTADKATIVRDIINITNNYAQQGYRLTLRQLYYQLVAADSIPNHDKVYKKIGSILDDCRYSGNLDWNSIEDRGRVPKLPYWVNGIKDALNDTINAYRLNRQEDQPTLIELWTEKDAISNILYRVTSRFHVNLVVNKGYTSSSALYTAYERFLPSITSGKKVTILSFGDHDPSGLDMVRDIKDRILKFLTQGEQLKNDEAISEKIENWWKEIEGTLYDLVDEGYLDESITNRLMKDDPRYEDVDLFEAAKVKKWINDKDLFEVLPIGLKMDQIKLYKLPHNPAKITDPRAQDYIKKFGQMSWEVDALPPNILTKIVEDNILQIIDAKKYNAIIAREKKEQKEIKAFADKHK